MEMLELSIINELALKTLPQEIKEFRSMCIGTVQAIEQILKDADNQSYKLFKKLRLLFDF